MSDEQEMDGLIDPFEVEVAEAVTGPAEVMNRQPDPEEDHEVDGPCPTCGATMKHGACPNPECIEPVPERVGPERGVVREPRDPDAMMDDEGNPAEDPPEQVGDEPGEPALAPGLDQRAGEVPVELSTEMQQVLAILVASYREVMTHITEVQKKHDELIQSHMARQNMLLDSLIFTMSVGNVATRLMLNGAQKLMYNSDVTQMTALRQKKMAMLQAQIEDARNPPSVA